MTTPLSFVPRLAAIPLVLLGGAAVLGCTPRPDVCYELTEKLNECGFVITDPNCGEVRTDVQTALLDAMGDECVDPALFEDGGFSDDICRFAGWSCPGPLGPEPGTVAARNTILFVGGIDDTPVFDWSPRIIDAVANVHDAHHVPLTSFGTVEQRALDLHQAIAGLSAGSPDRRYNLVCYAVGGRDCRYLVSPNGLFRDDPASLAAIQSQVATITTISTPHQGTRLAEAAVLALMGGLGTVDASVLEAFNLKVPNATEEAPEAVIKSLMQQTPDAAVAFNAEIVDAPGIYYQSYAAVSDLPEHREYSDKKLTSLCRGSESLGESGSYYGDVHNRDLLNPILWVPSGFAHESYDRFGAIRTGPGDGQVSIYSAQWGSFRGCLPADHWDVIGQIANVVRDPRTGFDAPRFYLQLASELEQMGY